MNYLYDATTTKLENLMKKIFIAAVAALAAMVATPAMASDFTGLHVEARAGADHINVNTGAGVASADGVTYGVGVGYDTQVLPRLVVGVNAAFDGSTANGSFKGLGAHGKNSLEATARAGIKVGDAVLVYGRVGYVRRTIGFNFTKVNDTESGFLYGGGAELAVTDHLYVGAEYRTTNFGSNYATHQGLVTAGFRF
jgi:outer membrane immunogenic protein